METNIHVRQAIGSPTEPSDAAVPLDADTDTESESEAAQLARSEENILRWMAYLPEDCIATMIAMGWDITT